MSIRIALAGNPNSGKTTLFNALTGSNQYVGNWPGVTVEKKEGKMKGNKDVIFTDLPGIYSLSPYTLEEVVARNYLIEEKPDAILNIIDGTNLERNLYLTTQLMEIGVPVVIAINMMDVVRKNGDKIDIPGLSAALGCEIIEISALKGDGITDAANAVISAVKEGKCATPVMFSGTLEHALAHIEEAAVHDMAEEIQRWYAIKIFERDEKALLALALPREKLDHIENDIKKVEEKFDDDAESIIISERYDYVTQICGKYYKKKNAGRLSLSDKIDRIATNRILALPIFVVIMWLVYTISITTVGNWTTNFMNGGLFGSFSEMTAEGALPSFMQSWASIPELLDKVLLASDGTPIISEWLYSLIMDGIIGGVGSVLGFVPQMVILFLLLSLLEDCGYMSRIAFIMDKLFRKFGLSGKSFIPLLVASGCGVPGVMASRTIEQDRDRKMTVMTTCFIPCGAKMPIVGLVAAALFGGSAWVATAAYFVGIGAVIISGIILKKTKAFSGNPAPFVMELPAYHMPVASNVLRTTWDRGWGFIKRAGTVIFAASIIIWVLNSISFTGGLHYITEENGGASILQYIGNAIRYIFIPLGFGSGWEPAVATILGLVAKEEVVGVFGTLAEMLPESAGALAEISGAATDSALLIGKAFFDSSKLSAFSFLIFNLLCAPCFAAMGAIKKEMNSAKWTFAAIGYMCVFAYAVSLIIYNIGLMFTGIFSIWTIFALLVLAFGLYMLVRKNKYEGK